MVMVSSGGGDGGGGKGWWYALPVHSKLHEMMRWQL